MSFTITHNLTDGLQIGAALQTLLHLSNRVQMFTLSMCWTYDFTQNPLHFSGFAWHDFRQPLMMSEETLLQVLCSLNLFSLCLALCLGRFTISLPSHCLPLYSVPLTFLTPSLPYTCSLCHLWKPWLDFHVKCFFSIAALQCCSVNQYIRSVQYMAKRMWTPQHHTQMWLLDISFLNQTTFVYRVYFLHRDCAFLEWN